MMTSDTIVAISSAVGEAARIIVRLSGVKALEIAQTLRPDRFSDQGGSAIRTDITFNKLTIPAFLYVFRGPRSYTGEDSIEIHLPGNPLLARMLINHCIQHGARLAEPGEFTARAYFNGRLDLTEAEGVAATIAAHGEAELSAARQLLAGELSKRLRPAMDLLADTLALVEVGIDFTDEDVTFLSPEQIAERLQRADAMLAELKATSGRFEKLTHEPRVVLVGPPNAGKSTLLNALAKQDRAVVSPIAGTTRDVLSATVFLRRGSIQLIDVAGLDAAAEVADALSSDETHPRLPSRRGSIDTQMQSQARQAIDTADLLIDVRPPGGGGQPLSGRCHLVVHTKSDLERPAEGLAVSAVTGEGLDLLRDRLDEMAFGTQTPGVTLALTARHLAALDDARQAIGRAGGHREAELIALDLREALDALGSILGVIAPDELLGRIFATFCIGK